MIAQLKKTTRSFDLLCLGMSVIMLSFCCVFLVGAAIAESEPTGLRYENNNRPGSDEQTQRTRRPPPQMAIDACQGKKEGASCTMNSQEGLIDGSCLSGNENIFACRPHRNKALDKENTPISETAKGAQPRQHDVQVTAPRRDAESLPRVESPPARQTKQSAAEPPPPSIQATPALQPENTPLPSQPESSNLFENLRQHYLVLGSCLIIAIVSAGLAWYGLYRHATLPLRRLRKVTQQLASGNLSARVGEGLVHRKSEVVDLGRDVDRMAERIESLVGAHQRLIRDVSHELRSPLARLNVALELARHSAGPTLNAPFERIERESERLNELISQLLTLTKLESDTAKLPREEVDLSALLAEIAIDVDYEAKSCNRRVEVVKNALVKFTGNRELLRQALENIIRNAVRYTADGTAVEVSLVTVKLSNGKWAALEVRDHGNGVPESELTNIFRPFYRVSVGRERESGGTGVGLAITERAVRIHGGNIEAENSKEGGLIVRIELPLA